MYKRIATVLVILIGLCIQFERNPESNARIIKREVGNVARRVPTAAICVIQKDGLRYIDEWVIYNTVIGFEKFYFYDNSESFELQKWYNSSPTTVQQRVHITHFPGYRRQKEAYMHCWQSIRKENLHSWIAFFDIDEFLVIRNYSKYPTIIDLLQDLPYEYGGLALNWVMFGFNNHTAYEEKPLSMRFQKRAVNATVREIKTIVRSNMTPNVRSVHYVKYNRSLSCRTRDTRGNIVERASNSALADEVVALYHYHAKSFEEFKERCARGDASKKKSEWKVMLACKPDKEILESFPLNENIVDDAPWRLLQERAPRYTMKFQN